MEIFFLLLNSKLQKNLLAPPTPWRFFAMEKKKINLGPCTFTVISILTMTKNIDITCNQGH